MQNKKVQSVPGLLATIVGELFNHCDAFAFTEVEFAAQISISPPPPQLLKLPSYYDLTATSFRVSSSEN